MIHDLLHRLRIGEERPHACSGWLPPYVGARRDRSSCAVTSLASTCRPRSRPSRREVVHHACRIVRGGNLNVISDCGCVLDFGLDAAFTEEVIRRPTLGEPLRLGRGGEHVGHLDLQLGRVDHLATGQLVPASRSGRCPIRPPAARPVVSWSPPPLRLVADGRPMVPDRLGVARRTTVVRCIAAPDHQSRLRSAVVQCLASWSLPPFTRWELRRHRTTSEFRPHEDRHTFVTEPSPRGNESAERIGLRRDVRRTLRVGADCVPRTRHRNAWRTRRESSRRCPNTNAARD